MAANVLCNIIRAGGETIKGSQSVTGIGRPAEGFEAVYETLISFVSLDINLCF